MANGVHSEVYSLLVCVPQGGTLATNTSVVFDGTDYVITDSGLEDNRLTYKTADADVALAFLKHRVLFLTAERQEPKLLLEGMNMEFDRLPAMDPSHESIRDALLLLKLRTLTE
tara:strand:- start:68 stop:409 length:342 start_codon:yes stop_codon:yes gene_type:complete